MNFLVNFSARDLNLVIEALDFYSRQTMMFGRRAEWAARMSAELEALKARQEA